MQPNKSRTKLMHKQIVEEYKACFRILIKVNKQKRKIVQIYIDNMLKKVQVKQQQRSQEKENQKQNSGSKGFVKKQYKEEN